MKILGAEQGPRVFIREKGRYRSDFLSLFVSETNEKQGVLRASVEVEGQV